MDSIQRSASPEGVVRYGLNAVRDRNLCQRFTAGKSALSDQSDHVGKTKLDKLAALRERLCADFCNAVRQYDTAKVTGSKKCDAADLFDAVRQDDIAVFAFITPQYAVFDFKIAQGRGRKLLFREGSGR